MLKVKPLQLMILGMIVISILFPFVGQTSNKKENNNKRVDRINIQPGIGSTKNEMPEVSFLHDLHTQAVEGKCTACHVEKQGGGLVFKFKRTDEQGSMDFYHDNCIACHVDKKAANEKAGPVSSECRTCHVSEKSKESSWEKINFDKSLHFIHERSDSITGQDPLIKDNCSTCHHKYDEKTNETFYIKGEEESCAYCHKSTKQAGIRPVREASHDACVKCHQTLKIKNIVAGPITCKGCHDTKEQEKITKISDVPRLKRNQPDAVILTAWTPVRQKNKSYMNAVSFDHKFHETKTQSCKSCHHETLKKCNDCHGIDGEELKGGFISLERAMHNRDNTRSCVGCHKEETKSPDCAGCHFQAPVKKDTSESCKTCHTIRPDQLETAESGKIVKTETADMSSDYKRVAEDKIPETIVIDVLANEYMPSQFPHGKMVKAIFGRVEKSDMAKAFHGDQAGLCMGCHHNSPKTLEPPQCVSCHSKTGPGRDGRPGLKGAYHGQCITCHQKMDVQSVAATDCAKCHEQKK